MARLELVEIEIWSSKYSPGGLYQYCRTAVLCCSTTLMLCMSLTDANTKWGNVAADIIRLGYMAILTGEKK